MISEIDLLREDLPRLEMKFGADNPFVEVLKAELASLQNQTQQLPQKRHSNLPSEKVKSAVSSSEKNKNNFH